MTPVFIDIKELRQQMKELRSKGMDFLRDLIGIDWGEEGLGVIYSLENSSTKENKQFAVRCSSRENPQIPTVCDIWKVAELYEREVYDFFGIEFITGFIEVSEISLFKVFVFYKIQWNNILFLIFFHYLRFN